MRILIIDDHPLVRAGARLILSRDELNTVVGDASDATQGLQMVADLKPDLVTLDVQMPGLSPEVFAVEALAIHPDLKILVVSAVDNEEAVHRFRKVRISGYLLKDEAPEHLLQAVRAIAEGAAWFSTSIAAKLVTGRRESQLEKLLTNRELEVLRRIADGQDNRKISTELCLAEQTVRNYATTIYSKINVTSRVEAVVWMQEQGRCLKASA